MRIRPALVLVSLLSVACTPNESDKPDKPQPAASATAATPKASSSSAAAKAAGDDDDNADFAFQQLAVGQFVEYRNGDKRYAWAVVGEEDGAFWMQLAAHVDGQPMSMQMLVAIKDGTEIHTAKPKKMKFKIPGRGVQEIDGRMLAMGSNKMKNRGTFLLDMTAADISKGEREQVAVKAGKFNAFRWKGKTKKGAATFWSHRSVPITGIVKGTDADGTWELVAYGKTGAKSEI